MNASSTGGSLFHAQDLSRTATSPLNVLRRNINGAARRKKRKNKTRSKSPPPMLRSMTRSMTMNKSMVALPPVLPRQRNVVLELADASLMAAVEPGPRDVPEYTALLLTNRVTVLSREKGKVLRVKEALSDTMRRQNEKQLETGQAAQDRLQEIVDVNERLGNYRQSLKDSEITTAAATIRNKRAVLEQRAAIGVEMRQAQKKAENAVIQAGQEDLLDRTWHNQQMTAEIGQTLEEHRATLKELRTVNGKKRRAEKHEAEDSVKEAKALELVRLQTARDNMKHAEEMTAKRLAEKRELVSQQQLADYRAGRLEQFVSKEKAQVVAKQMEKAQFSTLEALRVQFEQKRDIQTAYTKQMTEKFRLVERIKNAIEIGDNTAVQSLTATLASGVFPPKSRLGYSSTLAHPATATRPSTTLAVSRPGTHLPPGVPVATGLG